MKFPDPKQWLIENIGPLPKETEKRDEWLTRLGILVSYSFDVEKMNK